MLDLMTNSKYKEYQDFILNYTYSEFTCEAEQDYKEEK